MRRLVCPALGSDGRLRAADSFEAGVGGSERRVPLRREGQVARAAIVERDVIHVCRDDGVTRGVGVSEMPG